MSMPANVQYGRGVVHKGMPNGLALCGSGMNYATATRSLTDKPVTCKRCLALVTEK